MSKKRQEAKEIQHKLDQFNQQIRDMENDENHPDGLATEEDKKHLASLKTKRDIALQKLSVLLKKNNFLDSISDTFKQVQNSIGHAFIATKKKLFQKKHS